MQQFDQSQQHPELFSKFNQHTQSGDAGTDLMATETAWRLWQVMGEIFSNRWTQKNGAEPTALWIAQIGSMTEAQIKLVCQQCMDRCAVVIRGPRIWLNLFLWFQRVVQTRSA
ncbi:Uncharacterised protein [Enterobacter cancerogenus]|uniref:Uncharacterized protein n=1 Tax=Enterobacter cancerogenus TaxID=69218 RepID=A0A484X7Z2_9ENTR|nr:Uncharacterised protein [Enterobacter cancerogenus]